MGICYRHCKSDRVVVVLGYDIYSFLIEGYPWTLPYCKYSTMSTKNIGIYSCTLIGFSVTTSIYSSSQVPFFSSHPFLFNLGCCGLCCTLLFVCGYQLNLHEI